MAAVAAHEARAGRRKRNEKKKAANTFVPEPTDMLFYEIRTMSLSAFVHAIDGMDPNAECRVSGGTLLTWAAVGSRNMHRNLFLFPPTELQA